MGKKAYFGKDLFFDMGSIQLYHNNEMYKLSKPQRSLLMLFIERHDQLIPQEELDDLVAENRSLSQELTSIRKPFKELFGDEIGRNIITHYRSNLETDKGGYALNSRNSAFTMKIVEDEVDNLTDNALGLVIVDLFFRREEIQNEIADIQLQMSQDPYNISDELKEKYLDKTQKLTLLNSQINSNRILLLQIMKTSCSTDVENSNYSDSISKAKELYGLGQINEAISELRSNTWVFEAIANGKNIEDMNSFIIRNKLLISFILAQNIQNKYFSIDSINNQIKPLYDEILVLVVQSHSNYDAILDYGIFLFKFKLIDESIKIFQKLENLYSLDNSIRSIQWGELEYNWGKAYSSQFESSYNGPQAIEHFKKAIDYIIQDGKEEARTLLHILSYNEIAKIFINDYKYSGSLFYAFKALTYLKLQNFSQDKNLNIWGQIYSLIARSYRKADSDKCIDNYLRAIDFYERYSHLADVDAKSTFLEDEQEELKREMAIIYSNLYRRYNDILNYEKAEYYLNRSLEIKQELYKMNPYTYGVTYGLSCSYKAEFAVQRQDFIQASQDFSFALTAKEKSLSGDSSVHNSTILATLMELANLDSIWEDFSAAHQKYSTVLEYRRNLFKSPTPQNRERLFNILYNIGFSYLIQPGKTELAIQYLSEALSLFSFNDLSISSAISPEQYCKCLLSMARATRENGNETTAQKYYNDVYALCLFLESNLQISARLSIYTRAVAYYELGLYYHHEDKDHSLLLLNKSLELWKYLLSVNSKWYINDWLLTAKAIYELNNNEKLHNEIESCNNLHAPYRTHETLFYIF